MKALILASTLLLSGIIGSVANAQDKKVESTVANTEAVIKTSAVCGMCEEKIEKVVAALDGVTKADLDIKTKQLTVTYDAAKITPDKIREAISKAGYDADAVKADPKAYAALPDCCKKP